MKAVGLARYLCLAALAAVFSVAIPAYAQGGIPGYPVMITGYDPREVAMLPKWCIYTQQFRDNVPGGADWAKVGYWRSTMGEARDGVPIFEAMHHHCFALMNTNRAILLARGAPTVRAHYLQAAIDEFDYVIRNALPTFVLMPEILTKKGENLLRLGRVGPGLQTLEQAIELKPSYWPPYAYMSDHYKSVGDLKNAREVLEKGLASSPDANALKRRLTELGAVKDKGKTVPQPTKAPVVPKPPAAN